MVSGRDDLFQLLVQGLFDVKSLDHGLDDPVDLAEFVQVILDIADGDEAARLWGYRRRPDAL